MYGGCEWSGGSVVGSECVCEGLFGVCWGDGEVDLFIVVVPFVFFDYCCVHILFVLNKHSRTHINSPPSS